MQSIDYKIKEGFQNFLKNYLNLFKTKPTEVMNFPLNDLPDDILENIFLHLPGSYVCKTLSVVCQKWNNIIESKHFWTQKAIIDKKLNDQAIELFKSHNIYEWKRLYFKNPFNKNLINNPNGDDGFNFWHILERRSHHNNSSYNIDQKTNFSDLYNKYNNTKYSTQNSNGFQIENDSHGSKDLLDENNKICRKFSTTYYHCYKLQFINLNQVGLFGDFFEKCNLKLEVKDFYAARFDCGSEYHIKIFLLDENFKIKYEESFDQTLSQWGDGEWLEFKHVFQNLKDVRYVLLSHGGKDTQFWAGNYGIKISKTSVKLLFD